MRVSVTTRSPSTRITAVLGSARFPNEARRPSTVTRPAAMSSSQARREPTPAAARIFCSRCSPTSEESGGTLDLIDVLGQILGQRRQFVDAVDPQLLEEELGRPV